MDAIAKQHLGDCHITDDVDLTKLSGSCIAKYKHSTWTGKPLIQLPVHSYSRLSNSTLKARAEALNISLVPAIDDVVQNLASLANTDFANFSRFINVVLSK